MFFYLLVEFQNFRKILSIFPGPPKLMKSSSSNDASSTAPRAAIWSKAAGSAPAIVVRLLVTSHLALSPEGFNHVGKVSGDRAARCPDGGPRTQHY